MITPILERLILDGKARYKNWSYGIGSLGCIPVATGQTAIITHFVVDPFLVYKTESDSRQTQVNLQLLRLESDKTCNDFVLKWQLYYDMSLLSPQPVYVPKKFDCFIVANNPITIRIAVFPNATNWNYVLNAPLNDADEPVSPLGYYNSDIISSIDFDTLGTYKPLTSIRNKQPTGANARDEMNLIFNSDSNPAIDRNNAPIDQIPIINFSLVIIEQNLSSVLISQK